MNCLPRPQLEVNFRDSVVLVDLDETAYAVPDETPVEWAIRVTGDPDLASIGGPDGAPLLVLAVTASLLRRRIGTRYTLPGK